MPVGTVRVLDGDLGQAQQRPVAALGHELGVDPEAPSLARDRRGGGDVGGARKRRCGGWCHPPLTLPAHAL